MSDSASSFSLSRIGQVCLEGNELRLARMLAETRAGRRLLLPRFLAAYRIDELLALPAEARSQVELSPRPVAGAPPRGGPDQELPPVQGAADRLADAYRSGSTDPSRLLEALERHLATGTFGPATHSPYVCLASDRARQVARDSTARWSAGCPLGPLDGVPLPVKDEHELAGLPTRCGTGYRVHPARSDSFAVQRLLGAGALVHAKAHTTEWGMNPVGQNPHFDLPRNVYDATRVAGGSSTGSAVAVALGLAPAALGSDGGGSVRIPAALNGIFGFKPTFGTIGRTGDLFGRSSMAHIGVLGASTSDLVAVLSACAAAPDPADPTTAWHPARQAAVASWQQALGRGVRGVRIAIPEGEWRDADPAIQQACQVAVRALEAEGARLVDVRIPHVDLAQAIGVAAIAAESLGLMADELVEHGFRMSDELRLLMARVAGLTARDYLLAAHSRATLRRRLARRMAGLDLLALPTSPILAPASPPGSARHQVADEPATRALGRYAFLANITGLPAGSVPVGMHHGQPVGLQLIGDAWDDASVLAAMAHCERLGLSQLPPPPGRAALLP